MPGSAVSSVPSSYGSSGSRRAKTRQYRVISHTSNVDETLFGMPHHIQQRNQMLAEKWQNTDADSSNVDSIEKQARDRSAKRGIKSKKLSPKKETVQVITKDLIRNLVVPSEDPSGQSVILSRSDFERIMKSCRVLTKEEREAQAERIKKEKESLQDACSERKNQMKILDINRRENEPLNDLEEEAREKSEHLLERANEQRQEQEDEIKYLNELILNAKCHAIRDAQVLEKKTIEDEMEDEEKRLDMMMEVDRVNSIKIQEEIAKSRKEDCLLGAEKLLKQIHENEQQSLYELEHKDMENRMIQKMIQRYIEEDLEKLEQKKHEQAHHRDELNKANADMLDRKKLIKEQEKLAEAKVIEYMKQKAEREAAYEAEQERIRVEKEKETARLRALQERARDEQAERDELRAKRATEQAEREWRRKNTEEERKKHETEEQLKIARAEQMEKKEHFLAVQAKRDRAEFERVLGAQKELVEKEKREKDEHARRRRVHASDVRMQIKEKEQQKIAIRNAFFEEGVQIDAEARARRTKLDEIKKKKLEELKKCGIADHFLQQIAAKVNLSMEAR
ncbi:cilia- and flagella-associated protein 45-like isoform X2 [Tubulanus polymorphus]|uniref:cilia- and flagella-associated protein 45-like isoform X2 n=1 Tax=Tubulanus polymorphus TaxID=672921 RepID=UPI003DA41676